MPDKLVVIDLSNGNVLKVFSLHKHDYKVALKWCDEQNYTVVNRQDFGPREGA